MWCLKTTRWPSVRLSGNMSLHTGLRNKIRIGWRGELCRQRSGKFCPSRSPQPHASSPAYGNKGLYETLAGTLIKVSVIRMPLSLGRSVKVEEVLEVCRPGHSSSIEVPNPRLGGGGECGSHVDSIPVLGGIGDTLVCKLDPLVC